MSSERWVEPCSEGREKQSRQEEQQGEIAEEDVEVFYGDNEPAESRGGELPLSPDCSGMEDGTSEGVLEQVQKEEMYERKKFFHMNVNQESQDQGSECQMEPYLPKSLPRSFQTCSQRYRDRPEQETWGPGPFYYIGGANGAEIVSSYCESKGWKRIYNRHRKDFKLKWCEIKSPVNYCNFREGEQLVYQIPNNQVLTTKIGLLSSLRQYERVCSKVKHGQGLRRLKMEAFIPTTFRMDVREEREAFFAQQEGLSNSKSHMWICKPTGLNQGRGICLLKNQEDVAAFKLKLQRMDDSRVSRKVHHRQPQAVIAQRYIQNPLLLNGKKFDVRSYLLIACTAPYVVFFRHGYVRLTCDLYDPSSNNLSVHLTNQYIQKKNPLYSQLKEDTVWSMESFNTYVNDRFRVAKGLPRDWVLGTFAERMLQIMRQCFFAVKSKLDCRLGFFDLIGCDFMIDEDFKVWLLEMNCNPALHTNSEVLKEVISSTVVETLDLSLEIFNKCRLRQKILPLASQREFVLLYNGDFPPDSTMTQSKSNADSELCQKVTRKTQKTEPRQCKSETEGKNVLSADPDNFVNVSEIGEERSSLKNPLLVQGRKCILHYYVMAADDLKQSDTQQTRVIMSLSSSAVNEGISACGSPDTMTLPPHVRRPVCVDKRERGERNNKEVLRGDTKNLLYKKEEL